MIDEVIAPLTEKEIQLPVSLADYSEGGTVPWIGNASNMTDITVELFSRGCEASGAAYIRISTPWKDKGHGARLEYFTLNYTKAAN